MRTSKLLQAVAISVLWLGWATAAEPYVSEPAGAELTSAGAFDGYFYGSQAFGETNVTAVRGTISVKVTDAVRGKLTAHAVLQGGPVNFNGLSWEATETNGTKRMTLSSRGRVKATLLLYVRENRIWGTLEGSSLGETLMLDGARNGFSGLNSSPEALASLESYRGYYTVALPAVEGGALGSAEVVPQGIGYLTVTVGNGGSAKISGLLADGTKVVQSSRLVLFRDDATEEACVPLFAPLYRKLGYVSALLWLRTGTPRSVETDRDLGWFVRWENPGTVRGNVKKNVKASADGFSMLLDACGGFYGTLPALAASYRFSASEPAGVLYYAAAGGGIAADYVAEALPSGIVVTVTGGRLVMTAGTAPALVDGAYDYTGENSAQATIVGTVRAGLFKGKFDLYSDYDLNGHPAHKKTKVTYAGVLTPVRNAFFDDLPAGMGFYLVPDMTPALKRFRLKHSFPVVLETETAP